MQGKVLIFSAPSGSGKTTVVHHILERHGSGLEFSVSAASRAPRGGEKDGVDYHFISVGEFERRIREGMFVEWQQVYEGSYYGTLVSEVERIWGNGHTIIFDVDVKGGVNLKKYFGDSALSVFVKAPGMEELERRLRGRGTDSEEAILTRLAKAEEEMTYAPEFDYVLVNDDLQRAFDEIDAVVDRFLSEQ